jgi:hypothetical protein
MLKALKRVALVSLASVALAEPAKAFDLSGFNFCGGVYTGYPLAFCASVSVTVVSTDATHHRVSINVANLSGLNGSYVGSVFTAIGLDNLDNDLANPANVVVSQGANVLCTNYNNSKQASDCWYVGLDKQGQNGSGKIDILPNTTNGSHMGIVSGLDDPNCAAGKAGNPPRIYTCGANSPVSISFDIVGEWDPSNAELFVRAQVGPNEESTSCHTATGSNICEPTIVPEPATLLLMGSGFLGLVPAVRRRRKQS